MLHTLQLWLSWVISEAVYSGRDTLCNSDPLLPGSAPTLTSCRKGRLHPEIGVAVLKLLFSYLHSQFPPLLPFAPPSKVASTTAPGPLPPRWSLWVSKPSSQGAWATNSLMEGLLKHTTSHAYPQVNPTCSALRLPMLDRAWFKSFETCLWLLVRQQTRELPAFHCQQSGQGLHQGWCYFSGIGLRLRQTVALLIYCKHLNPWSWFSGGRNLREREWVPTETCWEMKSSCYHV